MIIGVFFCCFLFAYIKRMPGNKSQPVDCLSGISSIPAGKIDAVISLEYESWIVTGQYRGCRLAADRRNEY